MLSETDPLFQPITTQLGHAARMAAIETGFAVEITHVGIGASGYELPIHAATGRAMATMLQDERDRVPVQDVRQVGANQKDISFVVDPSESYYIREIGFFLADGTLYAVASHPTTALDWATPNTRNLFALELIIADGPPEGLTVSSTGPELNLLMSNELSQIIANQAQLMLRQFQLWEAHMADTGNCPGDQK